MGRLGIYEGAGGGALNNDSLAMVLGLSASERWHRRWHKREVNYTINTVVLDI
jgi:hypothetical protein